ncbi:uncharacterized protein DFL_001883 [Arthrobotrys flagrans]|uniref:Uncharacterized protein n=1 Tax=Arthrobotrys flagrans TaxID=97331 RepID=A0A437A8X3_ARTFL|nr:hypothetical protein DFL_001883 [Arthrobotrys flagrans]
MASADNIDHRRSRPRARDHLATYQLFRIVNEYAPFHLPARLLENAPALPDPLDAAVDNGLTVVDNFIEARAESVKKNYDRWVLRPRENIRTGVRVYTEWGKGLAAGNLRKLEEGILVMGNYLVPSEDEEEEEDHERDHEHAVMNSYWTSTESVIDTSDEEDYLGTSRIVSKDGKLRPLTPTAGYHHNHHQRNHSHQHHSRSHSHSYNTTRQRSASTPSLPPFKPDQPSKEVENIGRLLVTFAHRTYVRNAHKTPGKMLYDALDLARTEAKRVVKGFDEKYSIEIGYLHKMMEVGR